MAQALQQVSSPTGPLAAVGTDRHEFLTFALGREAYGIEILKVQEIRGYEAVTTIPNAPPFLKGVINLRGTIVPIVDLRIKLNFPNIEYTKFTVVIILNVAGRVIGVVVDSVSDVLALMPDQIKPAPAFSGAFDTEYILGMATVDSRTLILIDIEKLMGSQDMGLMDKSVQ
ncbi:MAG TPA: chemotaxis protein CheW [Burkholderiales bacterium]|nr:chemotaxis protein CheW [Burkholderiales bacterium]